MTVNDYADLLVQEPRLSESLKRELAEQPHDPARYFLAAVLAYRHGRIKLCSENLAQAVRWGFEWEEETALDDAVQAALPNREYHDFETIFLDVSEASPKNRWFALSMPVYEWMSARPDRRQQHVEKPAELFSADFDQLFLANGANELRQIIEELAKNPANAVLAETLKMSLSKNDLPEVASLILALVLEHIAQFADFFGLTEDEVQTSELQRLILMLPLRIAVAVILLYSVSRPQEMIESGKNIKDDALTAGQIAAAFIAFYQQADVYRQIAAM